MELVSFRLQRYLLTCLQSSLFGNVTRTNYWGLSSRGNCGDSIHSRQVKQMCCLPPKCTYYQVDGAAFKNQNTPELSIAELLNISSIVIMDNSSVWRGLSSAFYYVWKNSWLLLTGSQQHRSQLGQLKMSPDVAKCAQGCLGGGGQNHLPLRTAGLPN